MTAEKLPEVVFFDLDGTLIDRSGTIAEPVQKTVRELINRGVRCCLATGRPYFAATGIIKTLGITAPSMFFSGSVILDPVSSEMLLQETISSSQVARLVQVCREHDIYLELYTSDSYFVDQHSCYTPVHFEYLNSMPVEQDLAAMHTSDILKAVLVLPAEEVQKRLSSLAEQFSDLHIATGYGASHPGVAFVNLNSQLASRERCFRRFLELFGVDPENTAAFGDAEADLPFIQLAGTGVAMGNAPAAVREQAPHVAPTVEEFGVSSFFRDYFGLDT